MIPPDVRAVFFDAVGTLVHPDPPAAAVYATVARALHSRLCEAEIATRFRTAFAREEARDRANGWRTSEERERQRWRCIVAKVLDDVVDDECCFRELFTHFGRPEAWRCDPQVAGVLAELGRRGYALGVASNYDARLHAVLAGFPELRPLRHVVISSEVGWRKPAPEFFRALRARVGLAPAEVLYVGDDRANDYEGALAAGLRAALVGAGDGGGLRGLIG
jgi:putative hydrolase of the HAD superfamily